MSPAASVTSMFKPSVLSTLVNREADFLLVSFLATHPSYTASATADQFEEMHDLVAGKPDEEEIGKAAALVGSRELVDAYVVYRARIFGCESDRGETGPTF